MKKFLLSFILSVNGLVAVNAEKYTGVLITNGDQKMCYLFSDKPTVRYQKVDGVTNACLYIMGEQNPLVSVPLHEGASLSLRYDTWTMVNLNSAGYATFSCKDDVFIATNGVTAYKATISDEIITLTALDGNIPAGTGVLLYGNTAGARVDMPIATSGDAADVADNDMKATTMADGSLAPLEYNSWALGDNNQFLRYTGDAYIHNRAYLVHQQAASVKAMRMVFSNDVLTNVSNASNDDTKRDGKFLQKGIIVIVKNGVRYNIAGQIIK